MPNKGKAVGIGETANPVRSGQIKVLGKVRARRITGTMNYTFGKDGCSTFTRQFKAKRN